MAHAPAPRPLASSTARRRRSLAVLVLSCMSCRAPAPAPSAPGSAPAPASPSVALAQDATGLAAPATATVALPKPATVAWQPGAEGTLLGLDDADYFVARAADRLVRAAPALAATGPLLLVRQVAGASAQDTLIATETRALLTTAGVDWRAQRDARGCRASVGLAELASATAACPDAGDDALTLAAALAATARQDLRPSLRVESLQSGSDVQLRLAVPAWRLRWQVTLDRAGEVQSLEIPSRGLMLRIYHDNSGWWAAATGSQGRASWQWRLAKTAEAAHTWRVSAPPPGLALDDDRGRQALTAQLELAAQQGRAALLGPLTAELVRTGDQWRLVAARAEVLTVAAELLTASKSPALYVPGPLLWVKPQSAAGGAAAARVLARETAECLFVGAVASDQPGGGEQLFARSCSAINP